MPDAMSGPEPAPADEFDRELRELTEGTAGEPQFIEFSAAERARSGIGARRVTQASKRGTDRFSVVLFLVILLLVAAVLGWAAYNDSSPAGSGSQSANPAAPAAPVPAPSAGVQELSGTITPVDLFAGPPADPFTQTPADHWADGAAGIVVPAASGVGDFTRAQVAAAYAMARELLIAANLDRPTLLGGPPTALANLLTARERAQFLAGLNKTGLDGDGNPVSTRTWVASFAPDAATLIGSVIKVHGTMSARAITHAGTAALAVEVNYLFVYAVEPPHNPTDWMRVVGHEYGTIDFARWDDPGGALEPWDEAGIAKAGAQCGVGDGYIHPDYPSDRSIDIHQAGPVVDPYSLAAPLPGTVCARTTST